MRPLHHGGELPDDRNWIQRVNDSEAGVLSASILHSVGALFFAAGIALYLYVAHGVRRSRAEGRPVNVGLLNYAHAFTIGGIALNGLGGLMRLFETDHPGLERLEDSTWVQVLLVKHLFLVAGVGLAVWLTYRTYTLARSPDRLPRLERESPRMTGAAVASLATIMLAAVLGAMATNTDLAADLGLPAADTGAGDTNPPAPPVGPRVLQDFEFPDEITGAPVAPTTKTVPFAVTEEADRITIVLAWTTPTATLEAGLRDPNGNPVAAEAKKIGETITLAHADPALPAGTWRATVTAQQAVQEPYTLRVTVVQSGGRGNVVDRVATLRAGGEAGDWFEANLLMQAGANLSFEWSVVNSTAIVYFDVHLHPNPTTVTYPVRGQWNRHSGNYTHDGSTAGPSLLWENNGTASVRVHFRILGEFGVDSYVQRSAATLAPTRLMPTRL